MKRGARQARAQRVCCRRASRVVLAPVTADTLFAQHARLHGPPQQASPQAADQFFVDGLSSQRLLQRGAVRTGDAVILKVQPRERVVVVQRVEQRHHTFNVDGVSSQVQRLEHRREGQCSQVDAGASRVDASRVDCWFLLSQVDCSTGVDLTRVDSTACASTRRGCASTRRACCVESTQSTRLGVRGLDCVDSTIVHFGRCVDSTPGCVVDACYIVKSTGLDVARRCASREHDGARMRCLARTGARGMPPTTRPHAGIRRQVAQCCLAQLSDSLR